MNLNCPFTHHLMQSKHLEVINYQDFLLLLSLSSHLILTATFEGGPIIISI